MISVLQIYLKIDDEINHYEDSQIMFKFSPLLHKSIVNAVNVNKNTQGVSSLNLKSIKGIFSAEK